jgi:hypothetical protein
VVKRMVYDDEKHIHFVTCSGYRRRNFLEVDHAKRIAIGQLGSKLANPDARCPGFVVLPDLRQPMKNGQGWARLSVPFESRRTLGITSSVRLTDQCSIRLSQRQERIENLPAHRTI